MNRKQQEFFIFFCVLLLFVGTAIVLIFWSDKGFYTQAYRPLVEESNARQAYHKKIHAGESNQPRPYGLRERDIEKSRGKGYATY